MEFAIILLYVIDFLLTIIGLWNYLVKVVWKFNGTYSTSVFT